MVKLSLENWMIYLLILSWLIAGIFSIYLTKKRFKMKDSELSSEAIKKQYKNSKKWNIFFTVTAIYVNLIILFCLFSNLIDSFNSDLLLLIFIFSVMGVVNGLRVLFPITTPERQNENNNRKNYGIGLLLSSFAIGIVVLSKLNNFSLMHWFSVFVLIAGTIFLVRSLKKGSE